MDTTMILASSQLSKTQHASGIDRFYEEHTGLQLRARLTALRLRLAAFRPQLRLHGLAILRRVA